MNAHETTTTLTANDSIKATAAATTFGEAWDAAQEEGSWSPEISTPVYAKSLDELYALRACLIGQFAEGHSMGLRANVDAVQAAIAQDIKEVRMAIRCSQIDEETDREIEDLADAVN